MRRRAMSPPDGAAEIRRIVALAPEMTARDAWGEPDMGVLRLHRRSPPRLPIEVFGRCGDWIARAAEAAACPVDYVAAPLLASATALIGHARWAQAAPGWAEPPHLWIAAVGDFGQWQISWCRLSDAGRATRNRAPHGRRVPGPA